MKIYIPIFLLVLWVGAAVAQDVRTFQIITPPGEPIHYVDDRGQTIPADPRNRHYQDLLRLQREGLAVIERYVAPPPPRAVVPVTDQIEALRRRIEALEAR